MMKDPSYCYKFYWLEAIVQLISEGVMETTFDTVIDEMICNAWYSVREFHIHLSGMQLDGQVRDGLERAIMRLSEFSSLSANASKVEIKNAIREHNAELKAAKEQLINMVPYRALAGFFDKAEEKADWDSVRRMTAYIERINRDVVLLPYTLGESSKLSLIFETSDSDKSICVSYFKELVNRRLYFYFGDTQYDYRLMFNSDENFSKLVLASMGNTRDFGTMLLKCWSEYQAYRKAQLGQGKGESL